MLGEVSQIVVSSLSVSRKFKEGVMSENHPLLKVENIFLSFGGVHALREVSFEVSPGEVFSIIGPNGAGKTSMLNCISGRYQPSRGQF